MFTYLQYASSVVDIYNSSDNTWTTASLSQPGYSLVSTTVGKLVLFAGGQGIEVKFY
jgi:hypothetical protein